MPAATMKQGGGRGKLGRSYARGNRPPAVRGVTPSTLTEDGGLATLSADNICMHFVKYAVS